VKSLREVTGTIFDIDQTALHDGPGVRMTVYLKGCPLTLRVVSQPRVAGHRAGDRLVRDRCRHCEPA
jgi:pyruvate formate lyase activating enzyme